MNNLFLSNEAIDVADLTKFEDGINHLNLICQEQDDMFLRSQDIWNYQFNFGFLGDLFSSNVLSVEFLSRVLPVFIEREFKQIPQNFQTEKDFDTQYSNDCNGFLGIDFSLLSIAIERRISNTDDYNNFKNYCLSKIDFRTFWENRERLFSNLILCGKVESQIQNIGNSSHFNQVISRLKELDNYLETWNKGRFSYKDVNLKTNLRISPESTQTMGRYQNQRTFTLPNLGVTVCELHIKTGEFRFHFYADETTRKVYIPYIGGHLDTFTG